MSDHEPRDPRVEQFMRRVGFNSMPPAIPDRGVVARWRELQRRPMLHGWEGEAASSHAADGVVSSRWYFHRGADERIMVDVIVGPDAQHARERFLAGLGNTMRVEIVGEPVSPSLGDLGVYHLGRLSDFVAWTFLNVSVTITQQPGGTNPVRLAREVQTWMESFVVENYSYHQPLVTKLECQPPTVAVGQSLIIEFEIEPSAMAKPEQVVEVAMRSPLNHLVLDRAEGQRWHWRAARAGDSVLEVIAFYGETGVSTSHILDVSVE